MRFCLYFQFLRFASPLKSFFSEKRLLHGHSVSKVSVQYGSLVKFYDFDKTWDANIDKLVKKVLHYFTNRGNRSRDLIAYSRSILIRGGGSVMSQPQNLSLSMEQQFSLRKYEQQAKNIPREELENLFVEIIRQKMAQENLFKKMIQMP